MKIKHPGFFRPEFFIKLTVTALILAAALGAQGCAGAARPIVPVSEALDQARAAPEIRKHLLNGDWLVIRGTGKGDNLVSTATNMPLSHAAIYDAEHDAVIESDAAGVHFAPLEKFIGKAQRVLIIRPVWSSPASGREAVARARTRLGSGYNFSGLIGLDTPGRYYCTQLVVDAYKPHMADKPNPIPKVIAPGQMYHWGRIVYDTGP